MDWLFWQALIWTCTDDPCISFKKREVVPMCVRHEVKLTCEEADAFDKDERPLEEKRAVLRTRLDPKAPWMYHERFEVQK